MGNRIAALAALLVVLGHAPAGALDRQSYRFHDRLISIVGVSSPSIFEDAVIFTASGTARSVGIAFSHEGYGEVHQFQRLAVRGRKDPQPLFYVYEMPRDLERLEYRLVIDGLWTADPWNPDRIIDPNTGLSVSVLRLPPRGDEHGPSVAKGLLRLAYDAPSGAIITVAGNFNAWDPFMYELAETMPGHYELDLPLPPGTYQYAFFYRGERLLDPSVPRKVYTREGMVASEVAVR